MGSRPEDAANALRQSPLGDLVEQTRDADGDDALPDGLSDAMLRKILIDNPLSTYPRLRAAVEAGEQRISKREEMAR